MARAQLSACADGRGAGHECSTRWLFGPAGSQQAALWHPAGWASRPGAQCVAAAPPRLQQLTRRPRQVLGCGKRMDDAASPEGDYYQRYRVCQAHLTLSVLLMQSVPHRFCQVTAPRPQAVVTPARCACAARRR